MVRSWLAGNQEYACGCDTLQVVFLCECVVLVSEQNLDLLSMLELLAISIAIRVGLTHHSNSFRTIIQVINFFHEVLAFKNIIQIVKSMQIVLTVQG